MVPNWCHAPSVVQSCTAWCYRTPAWSVPATTPACKLVTDEVLHLIGKIQPLLIGCDAP